MAIRCSGTVILVFRLKAPGNGFIIMYIFLVSSEVILPFFIYWNNSEGFSEIGYIIWPGGYNEN